jgi:rhodanese-related sulfurtransferase
VDWPRITPLEAARHLREDGYAYLDVRTVEEFELGHPSGAFNVPWLLKRGDAQPNPHFVQVVQAKFPLQRGLVVGCQSGNRSRGATAALIAGGYEHVLEQRAGYGGEKDAFGKLVEPGWERAGLPTETTTEAGHSYQELCGDDAESGGSAR